MLRRCAFFASFWAVVLSFAAGCSTGYPTRVFPVKGKLTVGDKPAAGAHLVFHALDQRIVSRPVGLTGPDGSFRLMTYAVDDGAPAGDYIVTIFWRDDSIPVDDCEGQNLIKHDRLWGIYFDSTKSPLRATVRPGPNDIAIQAIDPSDFLKTTLPGTLGRDKHINGTIPERRPGRTKADDRLGAKRGQQIRSVIQATA